MASVNIYPPILDSSLPAFKASDSELIIPFSMSKVSLAIEDVKSIHISIVKQATGKSVVNTIEENDRYRSSGMIILNTNFKRNIENIYSIKILDSDILNSWTPGWIYKIQIRLSTIEYNLGLNAKSEDRINYLNQNANNFSEWSAFCVIKAIGDPKITIPFFNNQNVKSLIKDVPAEIVDFNGYYENEEDTSEILYSYDLELYDMNHANPIDKSGIIYSSKIQNINQFLYTFNIEFKSMEKYKIKLHYKTINNYEETIIYDIQMSNFYFGDIKVVPILHENLNKIKNKIDEIQNQIKDEKSQEKIKELEIKLQKITNFYNNFLEKSPSITQEEEEGRICIKLYYDGLDDNESYGNYCLRRSDSKDGFLTWKDIKIISFPLNDLINNSEQIFYDYTIESNIFYKYSVQKLDKNGKRISGQGKETEPIIREFEYSYLLGDGGRQLKLNLSNNIDNYAYSKSDIKTDTIGGQYPFISRNGAMNYRTFSITGFISSYMDDKHTFTNDNDLYGDSKKLYDVYRRNKFFNGNKKVDIENSSFYINDYKREFDFRENVLSFLQDGKPKLFKSTTEGNIIVRLVNVTLTPQQSLNRMIGNFNATAYEIAPVSMDNYSKFNLYNLGSCLNNFGYSEIRQGQLFLENVVPNTNIFKLILSEYENIEKNIKINSINNMSIKFLSDPLLIQNVNGDIILGNNMQYNNMLITVLPDGNRLYNFDEEIIFNPHRDVLKILGSYDSEMSNVPIDILINFSYDVLIDEYLTSNKNKIEYEKLYIGQIFKNVLPNEDLFEYISNKYSTEDVNSFSKLINLQSVSIEAEPNSIFKIKDSNDDKAQVHIMNETGILNIEIEDMFIEELIYMGIFNEDKNIIEEKNSDIIINYLRNMRHEEYDE